MCTAIVALGLVIQQGFGDGLAISGHTQLERIVDQAREDEARQLVNKAASREAALQEKQFVDRFNELVLAMGQFSKKYKSGHVIDVKAVQSIKKAYKNLEKADPWFKSVE